jgi:hypothetical protein
MVPLTPLQVIFIIICWILIGLLLYAYTIWSLISNPKLARFGCKRDQQGKLAIYSRIKLIVWAIIFIIVWPKGILELILSSARG